MGHKQRGNKNGVSKHSSAAAETLFRHATGLYSSRGRGQVVERGEGGGRRETLISSRFYVKKANGFFRTIDADSLSRLCALGEPLGTGQRGS